MPFLSGCNSEPPAKKSGTTPAKKSVAPCANRAQWDMNCALCRLCKTAPDMVDEMRNSQTVYQVDRVFFEDPWFDGTQWTTKTFEAGGTSGGGEITILTDTDCDEAATTLYHETWHAKQPPGMGWPHPAEDDAYYHTELWTIENGLPSQGNPPLRKTDSSGKVVPDKDAIRKKVDAVYPQPSGKAGPDWTIRSHKDGPPPQTKWFQRSTGKHTWKASQAGDSYAGPEQVVNKRKIDSSKFKCP